MITVLKHGKKFQHSPITCKKCGCEFKYEDVDTKKLTGWEDGPFGKESYTYIGIACPECNTLLEIGR